MEFEVKSVEEKKLRKKEKSGSISHRTVYVTKCEGGDEEFPDKMALVTEDDDYEIGDVIDLAITEKQSKLTQNPPPLVDEKKIIEDAKKLPPEVKDAVKKVFTNRDIKVEVKKRSHHKKK